ncbi:MAG: redoxin domain-containing protein [Gammaproteobacteria bacterium]|nr:redoxin domain-containing protein [Gammaproteobacteria bacterium]
MSSIHRGPRGAAALLSALLALAGCDGGALPGLVDLDGRAANPLSHGDAAATVALFVDSDCPVSNRYAPEVRRLHRSFAARGVRFWLVYPDPDLGAEDIRAHLDAYGYEMPALRDPEHALVARARAQVTPEAAVFLPDGSLAYHGRIDDRYVAIGRQRAPTRHDLEEVLEAVLAGRDPESGFEPPAGRALAFASRPGIGCFIEDLR